MLRGPDLRAQPAVVIQQQPRPSPPPPQSTPAPSITTRPLFPPLPLPHIITLPVTLMRAQAQGTRDSVDLPQILCPRNARRAHPSLLFIVFFIGLLIPAS